MRISIGSDHRGYEIKEHLKKHLGSEGHEISDAGTWSSEPADYPVFAAKVARAVASGDAEKGVLICGSGMGMCIAANKIKGVRSALARKPEEAALTVKHNDTNVICLAGSETSPEIADSIIKEFLTAEFEGGRHTRRVEQIKELESGT